MILMIFFESPSISATSPLSRSVTAKILSRLKLFICLVGRFSTGTITFQLSFISFMPHSGGVGGSFCRKRAMMSICFSLSCPEVPQFGIPAGEPMLIRIFRNSVPRCSVMSGVSGLPVAPLRSTP